MCRHGVPYAVFVTRVDSLRTGASVRAGVPVSASCVIAAAATACSNSTSAASTSTGGGRGRGGRGGAGGAAPVVTAQVTEKDVPVDIAAIGNVEAQATIS